jgi:hypothetical protein
MGDLPFGRRVSVDGGVQSITLIHGPSARFFPRVAAVRPPFSHRTAFPLASPLYCHITYPWQTSEQTLKPCSQRAFPIFQLHSTGKGSKYPRAFLSPRSRRDKTTTAKRIDASRCKFVLFFTVGHPVAMPADASPYNLLTRYFYFNGDCLSRIVLPLLPQIVYFWTAQDFISPQNDWSDLVILFYRF